MTDALVVSLEEFADLVGITGETARAHLREVEGTPDWLIERGDRGRAYKIEATGAVAWWQARRDAEEVASQERRDKLAQLRFDLIGGVVSDAERLTLGPRARREEFEAGFKEMEFRKAMGELVVKSDLQHHLLGAIVELRRRLMLSPGEFAIKAGLDADQVRPLEEILRRNIDAFVTAIAPLMADVDA